MASDLTTASDLIQPEVWGPVVRDAILGKAVMLPLVNIDTTLEGVPGDTIHFPKFGYIGDAVDLTEGVAMETVALSMSATAAVIKEVGVAVELTDKAILTSMGQPQDQAVQQVVLSASRKLDKDIRLAAERVVTGSVDPDDPNTTPLIATGTGAGIISWASITAGIAKLGDEWDPSEMAGLVIHSKQHVDLLNDANFLSVDKFGAGTAIQRGQVGVIATVPVFVSDRATAVVDVDPVAGGNQAGYNALLIKKGAITLAYKRRPIVEKDRDILKRTTVITTNVHYAVKRTDDRGVVIIPTR